jgi:multicomponent Na+:H+ antiporter subunit F
MTVIFILVEIMLSLAIAITFVRLVIGPTMVNRVVALDLIAILVVGMMAFEAVRSGEHALLDVAVVVGITAFIGTAAFAVLIDRDSRVKKND